MLDQEQCATIKIGDELIVKGTRNQFKDDPEAEKPGNSIIDGGEILANLHGNNEIPTDSFIVESIHNLKDFDYKGDYTTQAYTITANVKMIFGAYATTISLNNPDNDEEYLSIYSSSAGQLKWLTDVACDADGNPIKTVTLNILLCNWNKKTYYRALVMSVTIDGVTTYNTLNFN